LCSSIKGFGLKYEYKINCNSCGSLVTRGEIKHGEKELALFAALDNLKDLIVRKKIVVCKE
jgi:hypothetical protein